MCACVLYLLINTIISLKTFQIVIKGKVAVFNYIGKRHLLHTVFKEKQKKNGYKPIWIIKKSLMLSDKTRCGSVVV